MYRTFRVRGRNFIAASVAIVMLVALDGCEVENGCTATDADTEPGQQAQSIAELKRADIGTWSRDDADGPDHTYMFIDATSAGDGYVHGTAPGVYADVSCSAGDAVLARFVGQARGTWDYRAALRLTISLPDEQPVVYTDISGAQSYFDAPENDQEILPVTLQGVAYAPDGAKRCRVGIKGKVFTKTMELFGAAALLVERYTDP